MEVGYTVTVCRTRSEAIKLLTSKHASWSLFAVDYGSDSTSGSVSPADFHSTAVFVLREMSTRQVLLPTVVFQEDVATDRVVKTMRLGVVDAILPPYTKTKLR